jgi:hypothetical protein
MMRPPFEEGMCCDLIRVVSENTAPLGKNLIEFLQGLEVFIDDRLVRQRPQAFGGLDRNRSPPLRYLHLVVIKC